MTSHSHTITQVKQPENLDPDQTRFRFLWADPRPLVIMLLLMRQQIMTAKQIAVYLDSHPETVTAKLRVLSSLDLVSRPQVKGGWMLTAGGWRFMLQSADNPRFDSSSSAINPLAIGINKAVVVSENADSCPKKPRKRGKSALSEKQQILAAGINAEVLAELRAWGINLNSHTAEIARRGYITPQFICGHAFRLRKQHKLTPGLLIQVLDDQDQLSRDDTICEERFRDIVLSRTDPSRFRY